jgi:hypothetical protein
MLTGYDASQVFWALESRLVLSWNSPPKVPLQP